MATATPILERKVNTEEVNQVYTKRSAITDEEHNSLMGKKLAMLVNGNYTINDIITKTAPASQAVEETTVEEVQKAEPQIENRYVENVRADSDLFRAYSAVNIRRAEMNSTASDEDEEENEDLRPTPTTIQYKTAGVKKSVEEGKIEINSKTHKAGLTKRDKIIIAVAFTVILALFILIIVNSAVISNLNSSVSSLQTTLVEVKSEYDGLTAEKNEYMSEDNLSKVVSDFATENGMILK